MKKLKMNKGILITLIVIAALIALVLVMWFGQSADSEKDVKDYKPSTSVSNDGPVNAAPTQKPTVKKNKKSAEKVKKLTKKELKQNYEVAIVSQIISKAATSAKANEYYGAYKIIKKQETDDEINLYAIVAWNGFSKVKKKYVNQCGQGPVPVKFTLYEEGEGYMAKMEWPKESTDLYRKCVKEMFPQNLYKKGFAAKAQYASLKQDIKKKARKFLNENGSKAVKISWK